MKRMLMMLVGVLMMVASMAARADVVTVALTVTNGQAITYSDPIPASGYLDKIEVVQDSTAGTTSTVTVATYSSTTAVETYCSLSGLTAATKLVRTRVLPTDNTGTSLAAAATGTNDYTAGTVLNVPYEKPMIGGNLKLAVTGTANDGSNTVTVKLYFEPIKK